MLRKEIQRSPHFEGIKFGDELRKIADEYINLTKSMFVIGSVTSEPASDDNSRDKWLEEWSKVSEKLHKPLLMTYDIVSNTICADLMDYSLRDTLYASMPKTFDKALLTSMKIVSHKSTFYTTKKKDKSMYRLGVSISRKKCVMILLRQFWIC